MTDTASPPASRTRKRAKRLRRTDIAEAVRSLGIMLEASSDEVGAIDVLGNQYEGTKLGDAFDTIANRLEAGETTLAEAVAAEKVFPPIVGKLLTVGSVSGTSAPNLKRAADIMENGHDLMQKVRTALTEPAGMLAAIIAFLYYDILVILPSFRTMFESLGRPIPPASQALEIAGNVLLFGGGFVIVAAFSWWAYYINAGRENPKVRVWWGRMILRLPVLGKTLRAQYLSQTFAILHTLAEVGMSEREALITVADASPNWAVRQRFLDHAAAMSDGLVDFPDIADGEIVPRTTEFMLRAGFDAGEKLETLGNVARALRREAEKRTENLTTALGPIANGVVSAVFVLVMLAIYLPVYDLISAYLAF